MAFLRIIALCRYGRKPSEWQYPPSNDNLAELLQALYQQQFCCLNCPDNQGRLADLCDYSKAKVAVTELSLSTYYSTENMLPGKAGAVDAASLPTTTQVIKCQIGDVLISNIRPYFKKIVYCHSNCGCSMDVICFTPKLPQLSAYLYSALYADSFFDFMVAGSKGTKMPRGDKQQIMTYAVHIPTKEEIKVFNALAIPILEQIENTHRENIRLSSLRDSLLPKLMSGELDVSELGI
ncbi:restriction endonuclease subunit S [Desulfovibrio sp. SGI.169]|uniref:restriction endonuclease subunit S n=1 Tax=Desulfovibrio sp. SGI.169 TaxID=3420561 RepID=UPI003D091B94